MALEDLNLRGLAARIAGRALHDQDARVSVRGAQQPGVLVPKSHSDQRLDQTGGAGDSPEGYDRFEGCRHLSSLFMKCSLSLISLQGIARKNEGFPKETSQNEKMRAPLTPV
jgi:hypothetical protein